VSAVAFVGSNFIGRSWNGSVSVSVSPRPGIARGYGADQAGVRAL
jgi:hypothetical protein